MIYLKNNTETQAIYIPRQTVLGGGYIATTKTYEDGLAEGIERGKEIQKDKLLNLYVTENGQYKREDGWGVVTVDTPDCPELTEIAITENGRYEGAYNVVNVDVPTEGGNCNIGEGEFGFDANTTGDYELYASDDGYDGWSKIYLHIYGDGGAIRVQRASDLLDSFNYDNGAGLDYGGNYYVGGIITEKQEFNIEYDYATYILDNGFKIYRGKWLNGDSFLGEDPIKLGAYAIVYGVLQDNNGELGLEEGSQVVAYQECAGGEGGSCNLGIGEYYFDTNDLGTYELYAENDGYDGWSKMFIHIDGGAIKVWRAANLLVNEYPDYGTKKYVGGEITEIQEVIQDCYKTYVLDNKLKIYRGGWFDGVCFNDYDEPIKVGDYVIVYGVLQDNNGELIIEEGSQVVAYQECSGGEGGSCNLEDKWVTPSMSDRDGNNLIVVSPSEGYDGLSRTVIDPQTLYNEGVEAGRAEGCSYNLINPIVLSEEAGNTINAENVQIPTFVYEGNQYYNVDTFNLADKEEFKIHILFKPNNRGDAEPVNIFGCEDTDWDNTTFGARIYQGQITFKMSGQEVVSPYTENTWYDVEMGYNTTKRWFIVNGETLLETEHAFFNKPSQTLMIGAINSGGNAFRPFYGKIAAIYVEPNGSQVWLLPKENGSMDIYWNNRNSPYNTISGENNARFEKDSISGDGMKSITWLGNLEDKWVTPSMADRDGNNLIVVNPSEGYNGLSRTVIDPQTIYNEGVEAGRAEGEASLAANARVLNVTENGVYKSKFSDPIIPANYTVTGVYADGTKFYSYAELNGKVFNTNIPANKDSRIEFWWKNDATYTRYAAIIGGQTEEGYIFKFAEYSRNEYRIEYGNHISGNLFTYEFTYDMTSIWNHIIFSKQDGLNVNGELICEIQGERWGENETIPNFWINAAYLGEIDNNANGTFGMIKINDTIIIPTADGFQNVNTGELLEVMQDGTYTFTENLPIYAEGELYKTINVNVPTVQEQITDYYYCPITVTDSGFGDKAKSFMVKNENMYGENGWINDDSFVYLPTANNMNEVRTKTPPSSVASFPFDDNAAQYTGALYMNVEQIQMNNVVLSNLYKLELGSGCHTLRMESSNLPNINTLIIRYSGQRLFDYHFSLTQFKNGGKLYVYEGLGNAENLRAALGSEWTIEYL